MVIAQRERIHELTCLKCNHVWKSYLEKPEKCPKCGKNTWYKIEEAITLHIPIPTFTYSGLPLKHIGSRCPHCGGTTGMSNNHCVAFCYSCDSCFDLVTLKFVGVIKGIGVQ